MIRYENKHRKQQLFYDTSLVIFVKIIKIWNTIFNFCFISGLLGTLLSLVIEYISVTRKSNI
jgi:hypothetical protein